MSARLKFKTRANQDLARYRAEDSDGVNQVMDSINLLRDNPVPSGALKMGERYRIHSGRYRIHYEVIDGDPVVVSVDRVGRTP